MPPNKEARCPGSATEGGAIDALCTGCSCRQWTPGVLYAVMKPAVRFTLRRGRYCINRKVAVASHGGDPAAPGAAFNDAGVGVRDAG